MRFCEKCGNKIEESASFCNSCGAPVEMVESNLESNNGDKEPTVNVVAQETETAENVSGNVESVPIDDTPIEAATLVKTKKRLKITKTLWIILCSIVVALIIAVVTITNSIKLNKYKTTLEEVYNSMSYGAEQAESYCSLESKVWRNCIMKSSSTETDKYTKNEYGWYYSDFNDALQKFYDGEYLTYSYVSLNVDNVNSYIKELKDCPDKFEDEYRAIKEMYVAYSDLTDLVLGSSSYSLNTFDDALEAAKSNYKTAKSAASLIIEW